MRYSREYLDGLAADARRLDREAGAHERLGHWVLANDKRNAASVVRRRLNELEAVERQRQLSVRFG